jgi:RHS repeat-associated protein
VRKYRFDYDDTNSVTHRSLLTSAKECADDSENNCFLPLTFAYQAGQAGNSSTSTAGLSGTTSLFRGKYDFNGDGKSDLLFVDSGVWKVALSSGSGFATPVTTGVASSSTPLVHRFLATHQDGLLVDVSGTWSYVGFSSGAFSSSTTGIAVNTNTTLTDNNGDGLADLVWTSGGDVMVRLNTSTLAATTPSFSSAYLAISYSVGTGSVNLINAQNCPFERSCDLNGDARADLIVNLTSVTGCGIGGCSVVSTVYDLLSSGSGYISGPSNGPIGYRGFRFNDDACIDRLDNASLTLLVSGCSNGTPTAVTPPATAALVLDWNGDGNGDLLFNNGGFFGVYLSTGDTTSPFSSLITTSIPFSTSCSYFAFDVDGDGFDDIGCVGTSSPFAVSYFPHNGSGGVYLAQHPDLLSSVSDGFGVTYSPSYVSTSQNNYTRGTGTQLPLIDATEPKVVVAQVTGSNGIGGTYTKTYTYTGARDNRERGEFAGFQRRDEIDSRYGLVSRTYFEQLFPLAGTVSQTELMQANGTTAVTRQVFTNTAALLDSTAYNQRHFVFTAGSTATQYEVGGTWNGNLLRTIVTESSFDNASGVAYDIKVTATEPASGANGVSAGGEWVTRVKLPLTDLINNSSDWCLGRPQKVEETRSHNLASYSAAITRTTAVVWNASYCRPTRTVLEPGNTTLEVTTDIGYDGFGNVNSVTMAGSGAATRSTSTIYTDATYTTGQFPLSVTTAESASFSSTSTLAWDYNLGVPLTSTDANGLLTGWLYDAFGRLSRENHADGTYVTHRVNSCAAGCSSNGRFWIDTRQRTAGNVEFGRNEEYFDQFDRQIESDQKRPDTYWNYHVRTFDARGNVLKQYVPYTSTPGATLEAAYDLLDRPVSMTRRISDANFSLQTSTVSYEGLTTVITDAQGKKTTRTADASGALRAIIDDDAYAITFDLDAFGNPKEVKGAGVTLQTSVYNTRGMLTERTDMDMGTWKYEPNALGEVVKVRDAKTSSPNWTQTYTFDALGRMTSRIEAEGTSTWTWGVLADNTAGSKYVGRLKSISGPGYAETYTYDALGRPSNTSIAADATYNIGYTYNDLGTLDTLTYPASTGSNPLKIRYAYDYGQLRHIKECANPDCSTLGTTYWSANSVNARGQITEEALGNSLVSTRVFDSVTGWLKSIKTGPSSTATVQDLEYEWDLVGNLKKRKDLNQSPLTEEFFYDDLYRLDYSTLNGVTNFDVGYDALGNITSKSGVGTYAYHGTKKHQVVSTSNGWTFGYDANGNMNSGLGTSSTWTSYNLPASIASTTNYSNFSYTPDRQYWRQDSNYASGGASTTIYVAGLLEKVSTSAGTDYRHMIRAGASTIIVSRQSSGTNSVYYVTSDHLGSSSAITDSSGGILVNSSFGAFGARRGSNWAGSPSAGDWSAIAGTTRRGFTEHTMLDNMNFIHMNGRVYDQLLGRFVSADPYVTDPLDTQNYNRYSYVNNNPLKLLDPSGFGSEDGSDDDDDDEEDPSCSGGGSACAGHAAAQADAFARDVMQTVMVVGHLQVCNAECMQTVRELIAQFNSYVGSLGLNKAPTVSAANPSNQGNGGVTHSPQGEYSWERLQNYMCNAGNNLQTAAEAGAKAAMLVEISGVPVAGIGIVTGNPPAVAAGGAMMGAGGWGTVVASGVQTLGGAAQILGGSSNAGWTNIRSGAINAGASLSAYALFRAIATSGRTVSQRVFNSSVEGGGAAAGLTIDAITYISPDFAPIEASCERP